MNKTKVRIIIVVTILILFVLPIKFSVTRDGGSKYIAPIISWYEIIDYNQLLSENPLMDHSDPNYEPPKTRIIKKGTEFKLFGKKLYLSPIFDMYDQSIISYDISTSPDFSQTKRMVDEAFKQYPNLEGLIFHSDQGWQYQHKTYQKWLKDKGIKQSFSRKGNCMDNSPMENFFGIMKNEMYYGYTYNTKEELLTAMKEYITYYNNERINIKRKGLSPLAYRLESLNQLSLA